jgi:nitrogen fixation/metabolism regulation signal transduction histidine kinase
VQVEPRDAAVMLSVDDAGSGVPDDVGSRIFEDYFTTRTHGAGIGLAVVRRIMEDHAPMGAKLAVERSVHGGASFRVTLSRDVTGLRRSLRPPGT